MKSLSRAAAAAIVAMVLASPCRAGQVRIEIRGGLVTLSAKDASVREILAEWARVGQVRIVNAERVPGVVTLELSGVPEARALDVLLRSVSGYVAAPRIVPATTSAASQYDRIVVMATPRPAPGTAAPPPVSTPPPAPSFDPRNRMGYQPQPSLMVDDQDEPVQQQPQPMPPPGGIVGASQPGVATPMPQYPTPGQMPQQPGTTVGSPAALRPGMTTAPPRLPGQPPGGPGGE
jgi:hypothetical protein